MAKGKAVEAGRTYWPRKKGEAMSHEGDYIRGVYVDTVKGEYKGQEKEESVFQTSDGLVVISSGTFTKVFAPNMVKGQSYYVTYIGLKDTKNGEAFQFEVNEDDGQA